MKKFLSFNILFLLAITCLLAQPIPKVQPESVGMSSKQLALADDAINEAIADKTIPGAVLAVVRNGKVAYLKAYGNKQVYPTVAPMTENTVFDLASVSKTVSTAISTMILIERGQLRLNDNVPMYIPNYQPWVSADGKKKNIRIIELLTHTSGLPSYADVAQLQKKYKTPNPDGMIEHIATVKREAEPGTRMTYSCLNFITLQRIVETISGQTLQEFSQENIFKPLGMAHTDYNPTGETLAWTAPTEKQKDGSVILGEVHDPLARIMNGGISGNAGVFSNAEDLCILAAALLNNGEINGVRILSPQTVKAMRTVPKGYEKFGRTLGWDANSSYASNSGDLFSNSTYGHTGYTGTSIILDPETNTSVILLAHRVHPEDKGGVVRLRALVANIVARAIIKP
jgi:CubicO group peptidase (beta-lactamase class C family)